MNWSSFLCSKYLSDCLYICQNVSFHHCFGLSVCNCIGLSVCHSFGLSVSMFANSCVLVYSSGLSIAMTILFAKRFWAATKNSYKKNCFTWRPRNNEQVVTSHFFLSDMSLWQKVFVISHLETKEIPFAISFQDRIFLLLHLALHW
jgi:hypothetical protein